MLDIKYLSKSWFSDVCSFVKFIQHKISDSMVYSLPILWKKNFFLWPTHQKYAIMDFCFLQAPQGRSSWSQSWLWSAMGRGSSMPNLVLYSEFALCSENFVVMLLNITPCCSRLRLRIAYFIYFKFTRVSLIVYQSLYC